MSSSTTSGCSRSACGDRLGAVGGLSDDVEALRLEQRRRGLAERLVVVDDQDRPAHGAILPEVAGGRIRAGHSRTAQVFVRARTRRLWPTAFRAALRARSFGQRCPTTKGLRWCPLRLLPVIALLALSGVDRRGRAIARRRSPVRRHDHRRHRPRPRPHRLPEQRHRDRRRQHHARSERPHDLRRRQARQALPAAADLRRRGRERRPFDGVTVRNGSVRGFAIGVGVVGVRDNRLVKLASSREPVVRLRYRRLVANA